MRIPAVLLACGLALGAYTLNASSQTALPDGWAIGGEAPKLYAGDIDTEDSPSGKGSVVLRRSETSHPYGSAHLAQTLPAEQYAGKRVRLHAYVRFQDTRPGQGGVWIGANGGSHSHGFNFGPGWTSYEATIAFPADLKKLAIGVNLNGPGTAKVDALELEVLGDAPPDQKGTKIDEVVQREDKPA
jgi:hypothetical protein